MLTAGTTDARYTSSLNPSITHYPPSSAECAQRSGEIRSSTDYYISKPRHAVFRILPFKTCGSTTAIGAAAELCNTTGKP